MDKKLFYLLLFLAATGFTAGVFFEIYMTGTSKTQLLDLLPAFFASEGRTLSLTASILQNFCSGLFFLLLCVFLPRFPFFLVFLSAFLFLQNLIYGISAALLLEAFGLPGGIPHVLTAAVPPALLRTLMFSGFAAISAYGIGPARPARSNRPNRPNRKRTPQLPTGSQCVLYAAALAALLLISLLQALLQQLML